MQPNRSWKAGDEYWALWISAEDGHYFPVCEGIVVGADARIVQLAGGAWRYVQEGLPFTSREAAMRYIEQLANARQRGPQSGVRELASSPQAASR